MPNPKIMAPFLPFLEIYDSCFPIPDIQSWCGITFDSDSENMLASCMLSVKNPQNQEEYIPLSTLTVIDLSTSDKVTIIPNYTFKDCVNLESLTIPTSVQKIGNQAFAGCNNLIIHYLGTMEQWEAINKDGYAYSGKVVCSDGEIDI